jgi:hypothetical protein
MTFFPLFSRLLRKRLSARPGPARRPRPLQFDALEDRLVMSTLFLVNNNAPVDGTHFHRFQDAYNVAAAGDTILIEPGGAAGSVGAGVLGNTLAGGGMKTNTITIDNQNIGAGEWVTVSGAGGKDETMLVKAVKANLDGTFTLWFDANFKNDHGPGSTVTTEGQLGIDRPLTLVGDTIAPPAEITSDFLMPEHSHDIHMVNLLFDADHQLMFAAGAHHNEVQGCTIPTLSEFVGPGAGNGDNLYIGNTLVHATINGDATIQGNDVIVGNHFHGYGGLWVQENR